MFERSKPFTNVAAKGLLSAALIGTSVSLSSCLDEMPPLPPVAYISIYQGSPDAPALDIYANSNKVNNDPVNFSEALAYSPFYVGERSFKISSYNAATTLLEKEFTLEEDVVYSMFLMDEVADMDAILLEDDWEDQIAGEAQIRFVHLSPDAGEVIVEITESETLLAEDIAFGENTDFDSFEEGTFDIAVKNPATGDTLVLAENIELKEKRVYTLVLRGLLETDDQDLYIDLQLITNYIHY